MMDDIEIWSPELEAQANYEGAVNGKRVEIEAAYEVASQLPVTFTTAGGVTAVFQADKGSQDILMTTLAGLPGVTPPGFWWLSSDNVQVPFTYADLKGLAGAMLMQGWAAFQAKQTRKAALRVADTIEAVDAIETGF